MSRIKRETRETRISIDLQIGTEPSTIATGSPFLDHMLITLARYSGTVLDLEAAGDLKHHLVEDVAIALGAAFAQLAPATAVRYGDRTVPMDEALVQVVLDIGGRPYYEGRLPSSMYQHFMRSFADNAHTTLHVRVLRGSDRHHIVEAAFKALGLALRDALGDSGAIFSTKGAVQVEKD